MFSSIFGPKSQLGEPWGASGPPCGTLGSSGAYRVRLTPAIWHQQSLPESRRVAPGTPHGHFLKALGRHFLEKKSKNADFYRLECSIFILYRIFINFSCFFEQKIVHFFVTSCRVARVFFDMPTMRIYCILCIQTHFFDFRAFAFLPKNRTKWRCKR